VKFRRLIVADTITDIHQRSRHTYGGRGGPAPRRTPRGQQKEGAPAAEVRGAAAPGAQPAQTCRCLHRRAVEADAPKVVWALVFQFDSTIDGKAFKIASMIDEHTGESLQNIVERSITAERLIAELERVFAVTGGPP
jgi:hypothetical protein